MEKYSGNFRVMDADGMTHSAIGARYFEDGRPSEVVIFNVSTVGKVTIRNSNAVALLAADFRTAWGLDNFRAIPTGLLCVHTEDYPLNEADNVLAEAERLRKSLFDQARPTTPTEGGDGADTGQPGTRPPSNNAPIAPTTPLEGDEDGDGDVDKRDKKLRRQREGL